MRSTPFRHKFLRPLPLSIATTSVITSTILYHRYYYRSSDISPISTETFTPWKLTSVNWLTTTTAVITLHPPSPPSSTSSNWKQIWKKGVWAVQIRQPQLQIQREYSPLPPISSDDGDEVRLLVRLVDRGEVSPYLLRQLIPGKSTVDVRGPVLHWSFPQRHQGESLSVLFIAGGTGISPALQAATGLLEHNQNSTMKIIWANRSHTEPILPDISQWVDRYKGRLSVEMCFDDREGYIDRKMIQGAIGEKDVILVSGPEGFIAHVAGKKVWEGGEEMQGPLGGLLGDVLKGGGKGKGGEGVEVVKL